MYIRLRENERLVTVIELLSPVNKRPGERRHAYVEKRNAFLNTPVHLVEIDLLRRWPRMPLHIPSVPHTHLKICYNARAVTIQNS